MSKIKWDEAGKRLFETGLDHGVLYPLNKTSGAYDKAVAWNGLTAVTESPSGAEATPLYADNMKYLELRSAEEFGATIECYTYPDEFAGLDGSANIAEGVSIGQQARGVFGLSYRTKIGNDIDGEEHGYKLHLIYGATAAPSERNRQTTNDSPEAVNPSWEITTTPVAVSGFKPTAHLEIDSTKVDADKLKDFEDVLYGTDAAGEGTGTTGRLPLPDEVATMFAAA